MNNTATAPQTDAPEAAPIVPTRAQRKAEARALHSTGASARETFAARLAAMSDAVTAAKLTKPQTNALGIVAHGGDITTGMRAKLTAAQVITPKGHLTGLGMFATRRTIGATR